MTFESIAAAIGAQVFTNVDGADSEQTHTTQAGEYAYYLGAIFTVDWATVNFSTSVRGVSPGTLDAIIGLSAVGAIDNEEETVEWWVACAGGTNDVPTTSQRRLWFPDTTGHGLFRPTDFGTAGFSGWSGPYVADQEFKVTTEWDNNAKVAVIFSTLDPAAFYATCPLLVVTQPPFPIVIE